MLVIWLLIATLVFAGFCALGIWQVERRAWKLDLIERVAQRIHAPAVAPPARSDWNTVTASRDEYRRIRLHGTYLYEKSALVQASTVLGTGYWVMTPLLLDDQSTVLVNRGFVPQAQKSGAWQHSQPAAGKVTLTGLMRLTEPGGGFLRDNRPQEDRWFSRDVQQIGQSRGLSQLAPYFVDADGPGARIFPGTSSTSPSDSNEPAQATAASASGQLHIADEYLPVGGLTVVSFNNNHLMYAITWFGLAILVIFAVCYVWREEFRIRKPEK
ncbi:SURF1 family protein [Advenella mimigardefordensis]|uniref:SURF1-like protein n=1 Tax=Advenella mimigardefordensis (strain DSM 17166 / LMG 22922 / DPN7) TaxID=1247726 RepID=W0PDZ8_ADVMD|nr:SURF1 family protein [Advenella mimigardefordensis]AHG63233.1 putative surfeit locus protein 1 [Advenella mimigardefordensis DPN7]